MSFTVEQGRVALERCNENTDWVPPHTRVIEEPDFCALVSPVASPRFNSVLRCRVVGDALAAKVSEIDALYADRRARFHLYPHRHGDDVRRRLTQIGFAPEVEYDARVSATETIAKETAIPGIRFAPVDSLETLRAAEQVITHVFDGERAPPTPAELNHHLGEIRAGKVHQLVAYDEINGAPVAQGGLAFYPELGIGLLFGGSTVASHRGRGIYNALIRARARACRDRGLPLMGLWAQQNTSSPITARHGFTVCGSMVRWTRDRAGG